VVGPAQVLHRLGGVVRDPHRLLQHPGAVPLLLHDAEDGVVLELERDVAPEEGGGLSRRPYARGLGLAHGPHAPRPVPEAPPALGGELDAFASQLQGPGPAPGLGQALGVEGDALVFPPPVPGLEGGRDHAVEGGVHGQVGLAGLEHHAEALQSF